MTTMPLPLPICSECGHALPPEDPTDEQIDAFVDDDSTRDCGECSALWLVLMMRIAEEKMANKSKPDDKIEEASKSEKPPESQTETTAAAEPATPEAHIEQAREEEGKKPKAEEPPVQTPNPISDPSQMVKPGAAKE